MSEAQDIRVWARERGIDIGDRGRIPASLREDYEAERDGQVTTGPDGDLQLAGMPTPISLNGTPPDSDVPGPGPQPPPGGERASSPAPGPGPAERPPQQPPGGRRRGLLGDRKPKPPGGPRPVHKRVSIENIVSSGWALGAMALARQPTALPVARVLDWQAPVAGVIVEDVAKGTLLDRVLQPLARGGEKAEKAMALAGPPLLVGIITANPSWAPALRPLLKMSMMSWFQLASPAMDKVQKRAAKFNEEFAGVDLDAMIDSLWAGVPEAGPPSPAEEEAIRRARGE